MKVKFALLILLFSAICLAQNVDNDSNYTFDASLYYGSILLHNRDISHLITEHPEGFILGYSKKTYGLEAWQQEYNYPDAGASFVFHRSNNPTLGDNLGIYAHFNFYFFKRNIQMRVATGLSYATNPYDKNENFRNNAYGSKILSSTMFMLNYQKENIINGLGFATGVSLIHYSNASVKAPNTSTNTLSFNLGLTYSLNKKKNDYITADKVKISEPIRYTLVFKTGINESDIIGSGQFPFYIFSGQIEKRFSRKSGLQFGAEMFFSNFLKGLIEFQSISFPENNVAADTDYKRAGIFVGHELFINKLSIETQLGYYVYYPYNFEGKMYNRIGLKRYFGDKIFGVISVKAHGAKAEAVEFGIGVRL